MAPNLPYLDALSLAAFKEVGNFPTDITPEQIRTEFEQLMEHEELGGVTRQRTTISTEGENIDVFIYKSASSGRERLPVILFLHGGGVVAGSIKSYDSMVRDLAIRSGAAVVFPEYTLAPQRVFPVQHEQCYATLKWVSEHGVTHGLRSDDIAIFGDRELGSAVNILAFTREPKIPIRQNVFVSPVTDIAITKGTETASDIRFFDGPIFTLPLLRRLRKVYIPNPEVRETELASPRFLTPQTAKHFPPTLIIISSAEIFKSEAKIFGKKLQEAGVNCAIFTATGQIHDSVVFELTRKGPTPQAVLTLIVETFKMALAEEDKKVHMSGNEQQQEAEEGEVRL